MQRFDPVFVCRSLVKRLLVEDEEPIVGLAAVDCWLLFLPPPSPRFGCTLDPVQTHDATLLAQRSDTPGRVAKYDAFPLSVDVHVNMDPKVYDSMMFSRKQFSQEEIRTALRNGAAQDTVDPYEDKA